MRLGILVNTLKTKKPGHTTYGLALDAINRGHEVWMTSAAHLAFDTDDHVVARARSVKSDKKLSYDKFVQILSSDRAVDQEIEVDDLDAALQKFEQASVRIEYGPVKEPWGIRRFFVRDPFGKLINILQHD